MKTFGEWIQQNEAMGMIPNQTTQPQMNLTSFANKVQDPNWHQLHSVYANQFKKNPNDPKLQQFGQTLYQAAQSGNMTTLSPYLKQYSQGQNVVNNQISP